MKITLLLSGDLGFSLLKFIHSFSAIEFVATDTRSHQIRAYSKEHNIPCFVGNPRDGKLLAFARSYKNELLLSINYLFVIEQGVIDLFTYPINFHGSLLPKYRGRTPHVWAIINNEKETGVTAHIMENEVDAGSILLQEHIPIEEEDTGDLLLKKYTQVYPDMVRSIIAKAAFGDLAKEKQDHSKATYFDKRTANDGEINWNWQKERIKNWVRAQANPYPGAFTFIENKKLIIDQIVFSDIGYDSSRDNGAIIKVKPYLTVKTCNGAVELRKIREGNYVFEENLVLGRHDDC